MIDIDPVHLEEIKRILSAHIPGSVVKAFGSRVNGKAQPYSDLDLVIMGDKKLDGEKLEALKDTFAESDLPMMIDISQWNDLSPQLRLRVEMEGQNILEG